MIGSGVPSFVVLAVTIVAIGAALALPVMAFVAMRALTRIAASLEEISSKKN